MSALLLFLFSLFFKFSTKYTFYRSIRSMLIDRKNVIFSKKEVAFKMILKPVTLWIV